MAGHRSLAVFALAALLWGPSSWAFSPSHAPLSLPPNEPTSTLFSPRGGRCPPQGHHAALLSPDSGSPHASPSASMRASPRGAPAAARGPRMQEVWVEPLSKEALTAAVEAGCSSLVFRDAAKAAAWRGLARFETLQVEGGALGGTIVAGGSEGGGGRRMGAWVRVSSASEQEEAMDLAGREPVVVVDASDWRIIPAENLIAAYQQTPTRLFVVVGGAADAKTMLQALETGCDGVVLSTADPSEVKAVVGLVADAHAAEDLLEFEVLRVEPLGMGDRVCVDTCSMLAEDEGLLVGSSAQGLVLVLSEAAESDYVPSRPFRVNAGPVHAYCLCPGGKTKYLSELRAGSEVLAVSADGRARAVLVGRAKIEKRPLVLLEAQHAGRTFPVLVQNAETVRFGVPGGQGRAVTRLSAGDRVLGRADSFARHVGMPIEESIEEV